jgi:hypothetical protein
MARFLASGANSHCATEVPFGSFDNDLPRGLGEDKRSNRMAKESRGAAKDVERAMDRRKKGKLKSGKGGKGGTVKSRKQAIAIGLSEARKKGKKVPTRKSAPKSRSASKK